MGRTTSGKDINLRNNNSLMYVSPWLADKKLQFKVLYTPKDDIQSTVGKSSQSLGLALTYQISGFTLQIASHHEQGGFKLSPQTGKAHAYRLSLKNSGININ